MKRMLFNATQAEELRVAIVDGQKLIDLDIESASKEQRKSNIYKGVITRIEPSLEAAFVDYGADRHGFLPFKEVSRSYFATDVEPARARIQDALREGQELVVQVDKDERGNKGAALTTYVSLAGRYLVLMPNNPRGGGVSRRVEGDERAELREVLDQLEVPNGMSMIARTAAIGRGHEELQWDLNYLCQLWNAIDSVAKETKGPILIYQEGSLVIRAIRDYFHSEIGEILIDTDDIYEQARAFMAQVMPATVNRVKRYHDDVPLFSRFQIEHQIESAYARQVNLPAGGAIVIDHTEALVAVDVNSGRATRGSDIEETALRTNCEAADEIARQLRLRDLGGLIVIDFIDMENTKNQREVENRLRDALKFDRARVQMGKISRFGLMELSRQRLRPALAETSYIPCPRCTGTGHIRSTESAALHILRILEEEAMKENTGAVHTQVPVDVATFLLNEKRADIQTIEIRHKVNILLIPNVHLETPAHQITRLRHEDLNQEETLQPSYRMVAAPEEVGAQLAGQADAGKPRQEAAIKQFSPEQPAPTVAEKPAAETQPPAAVPAAPAAPAGGILSRLVSWLRGGDKTAVAAEPAVPATPEPAAAPRPRQREGQQRGRDGRGRDGRGREGARDAGRDSSRPGRGESGREGGREGGRESGREGGREGSRREPSEVRAAAPERADSAARGNRETGREQPPRDADAKRPPRREGRGGEPRPPRNGPPVAVEPAAAGGVDAATAVPAAAELAGEDGGNGGRGRRGRRGRRGERPPEGEAGSRAEGTTAEIVEAPETAAPTVVVAALAEPAAPATTPAATPPAVPLSEAPAPEVVVASAPESVAPTPSPIVEPMPSPIVEPAPSPLSEPIVARAMAAFKPEATPVPPPAAAPAPITVAPKPAVDLSATLESSGLVMVETSAERIASLQASVPPEVATPRPRRVRPAPPPVVNEPLVQVETEQK